MVEVSPGTEEYEEWAASAVAAPEDYLEGGSEEGDGSPGDDESRSN